MFPVIQIGPLAIQSYGLVMILGIWVGLSVAEKTASNFGIKSEDVFNSIGLSIIAGLIGARLVYILRNLFAFQDDLKSIFSLNPELLDPWGAILFAGFALFFFVYRRNIAWKPYLDSLTPLFAIVFISYSLANLSIGHFFGTPSDLPWAIHLWGVNRHPVQLYQAIAGVIILIVILITIRRGLLKSHGATFYLFLALLSISLIFTEYFIAVSELTIANIRSKQLIAWIVLAITMLNIGINYVNQSNLDSTTNGGLT